MARMKRKTVNKARRRAARAKLTEEIRKLEAKRATARTEADRAQLDYQIAELKYQRSHGKG